MKTIITTIIISLSTFYLSGQTVNIEGVSYGTIAAAITAASDGDVINISGAHTATLSINKSITLKGDDPATDIIQASATEYSGTSRVIGIYQPTGADVNITIENLSIKNGNSISQGVTRGGGILIDKNTDGTLTLNNLIIEGNRGTEGGGIAALGSNITMTKCIIRNNEATVSGGGILYSTQGELAMEADMSQSLIAGNTAPNGGGIYINGSNGTTSTVSLDIENTTITGNSATTSTSGSGGGAIWSKVRGDESNVTLELIHATISNNSHTSSLKNGLVFSSAGVGTTNISAFNSIIVNDGDISQKAITWNKANLTDMVNCILGGLDAAATANTIIDFAANHNIKFKTATEAGLTGTLNYSEGSTGVIRITSSSEADGYCTASTGTTLPTIDQRGYTRSGTYDAGAYEVDGTLSTLFTDEVSSNSNFNVFPNPAKNFIKVTGDQSIQSLQLFSIVGTLEKQATNNNVLNTSDLSSGVYLLRIIYNTNKIEIKQVIIE